SSTRDLLVREIQSMTRSNGTKLLREAIEAGLVVQDKAGAVRDFFASETHGVYPVSERGPRPRGGPPGPRLSYAYSSQRVPQPTDPNPPLVQCRRCWPAFCDRLRRDPRYSVRPPGGTQGYRGMWSVWDGRLAAGVAPAIPANRSRVCCA